MHHTAAYFESIDSATLTGINAVQDDVLQRESNNFALYAQWSVLYAQANGANITRARLSTPSFRQITPVNLDPLNVATEPGSDPNLCDWRKAPLVIKINEQLKLEAAEDAAGASAVYGVIGLAKNGSMQPIPNIPIYTLRGTASTTLTANEWTSLDMTWDDDLPAGMYNVVGGTALSAGIIAMRFRFEDQIERPGALGIDAVGERTHEMFRRGGLGVWSNFDARVMPTPQILSLSADTSETVWMDIQPTGPSPRSTL